MAFQGSQDRCPSLTYLVQAKTPSCLCASLFLLLSSGDAHLHPPLGFVTSKLSLNLSLGITSLVDLSLTDCLEQAYRADCVSSLDHLSLSSLTLIREVAG